MTFLQKIRFLFVSTIAVTVTGFAPLSPCMPRRSSRSSSSSLAISMVMRDEYLRPHFEARTTVDRMLECASSDGLCDTQEMERLVAELEKANQGKDDDDKKDNDGVMDRNQVLKQALLLQMELQQTRQTLQDLSTATKRSNSSTSQSHDNSLHDHSFDHFVDYRSIGEFESH